MPYTQLECDVLIVGGGLAGTNAALAATEQGAEVIVAEKGCLERSGDVGGGVDHFMAYLNSGESWDTREGFLRYVEKSALGSTDLDVIDAVYCSELANALERMERIGVSLRMPGGEYYRTKGMGQPGPLFINFKGKRLKPQLAKAVRSAGCRVLDRLMALRLLTHDGEIWGALGMHTRTGEFFSIRAGATVISTGNTNRLFLNPRGNPFNSWLCPYDTGDGQRMALEAGARLSNMEYMRMTLMPKGFSSAGYNGMVSMGGRFLNGLGHYYMENAHPQGNLAPRNVVLAQSLEELKAGRGPLYIDCTHLQATDLEHLLTILSYEKDSMPDYFAQRGEDLRTMPVEMTVSEGMQAGPTEVTGSGLCIDAQSACSLPGLFACGDAADHNRAVHGAVTGGYHAGRHAALAARNRKRKPEQPVPEDELAGYLAPLSRATGYGYMAYEEALRRIMSEHAGTERSERSLREGMRKLRRLEGLWTEIQATDMHELARAHESRGLLAVGKTLMAAALFREESRFSPFHYRLDYPHTDNARWCGQVEVSLNDSGFHANFCPRPARFGA